MSGQWQFMVRAATVRQLARCGKLLVWFLCLTAANVVAQKQQRPSIADDAEAAEKKSNATTPNRDRRPPTTRPPRRNPPAPAPRPPAMLDVTFVTGVAGSDIFVNAPGGKLQLMGKTGADGKLATRMPRGVYNVTASRAGYNAQRQQISVQQNSTNFTLNLTGQPLPGTLPTAAEVLRRFSDPKQTDRVTAAEWQLVQQQTSVAFAANPGDAQVRAQSLFAQGQLAYLRRDYAGALVAFNNAALALPSSALAYYGLGNAYLATNQLTESLRAYQRAVELDDGLAMAYKGAGDVLTRQDKTKDAFPYYERARLLGYFSADTSLNMAQNLMRRERWAEAIRELSELSKAHPSAAVFVSLGDCYMQLKQPLSAAPAYRRAIELDPNSAQAHARYGEMMYGSREYAAASEALERALALDRTGASKINRARVRKMADDAASKSRRGK